MKKGKKEKKNKTKNKTKNKKGGVLLQDENGNDLVIIEDILGKMMTYVKRNWFQISLILFNMYIIYLIYNDLERLLTSGITIDSNQFGNSGLVVYNEGDKLVATLNAEATELEHVSIMNLILHYTEVAPKIQVALMNEYNDRVEEYLDTLQTESKSRARGLRIDFNKNVQEGVGINEDGTFNHLQFLYATMNPSATVIRVTDRQLTQARREIRDFFKGIERDIQDMRTSFEDTTEDKIKNLFYRISRDVTMLCWSGLFFIGLMLRFMSGYFMRRRNSNYQEANSPRRRIGNKNKKPKKGKKSKKRSKRLRR